MAGADRRKVLPYLRNRSGFLSACGLANNCPGAVQSNVWAVDKNAVELLQRSAEQLGYGTDADAGSSTRRNASTNRVASRMKFSDGDGNSWSGMGKRPNWLRSASAAGRSIDEFRTEKESANASIAPRTTGSRRKTRPSAVVYRDDLGHSWTGRGPKPRWLKEALASGKTLECLRG